tara:strand:+ start:105 stop:395 length:291 start_codon:yes stop_codon:yes gene_type:complete
MPKVKNRMTGEVVAEMSYDDKGKKAADKLASENPNYVVVDGAKRSEQMYAGGGKTGYNMIGMERPMMMGGGKMKMKYGHGGMTGMKKYKKGGKAKK